MFRGSTKVEINEATLKEALQEYWDRRVGPDAPKQEITKVETKDTYGSVTLSLTLSEIVQKPEAA